MVRIRKEEEKDPYWNQTEKDRKCVNISATHPQPQLAEGKLYCWSSHHVAIFWK